MLIIKLKGINTEISKKKKFKIRSEWWCVTMSNEERKRFKMRECEFRIEYYHRSDFSLLFKIFNFKDSSTFYDAVFLLKKMKKW